jgi:hypothetical protein
VSALSGKPLPPVAWEVAAASLLLLWRAWLYGWIFVAQDWFSILCAFWIFTALGSRTRVWPYVAGVLMSGLLVLYGWHQLPLAWAALGFGP